MSQRPSPPPPSSLPEQEALYRRSKYQRHRSPIALWALVLGLLLGASGGLYYAYIEAPVIETNTRPNQLSYEEKSHFVVAIMLAYSDDSDLARAVERLIALDLGVDPVQTVADMACDLARTGYVDGNSGLRAVRAMRTFYQLQGRSGCADNIIPDPQSVPLDVTLQVATPTATLPPPPTKTPSGDIATPTPSGIVDVPTTSPERNYFGQITSTYCNVELSGTIEVRVRDGNGQEVGGERILVRWDEGTSEFVTGLMPERGAGYADFRMEAGRSYIVSMPRQSDPVARTIVADSCFDEEAGEEAITSYTIVFQRQ